MYHFLRYQDAALTFSQSHLSFEEVALKFLQVNRKDALKIFLLKKLESLAPSVSAGVSVFWLGFDFSAVCTWWTFSVHVKKTFLFP